LKFGENPAKAELTKKDCVDLVLKAKPILNNPAEAISAFALCKQIVVLETSKKGKADLNKLNLVEFYDFIGRVT
jgi:hypothetical protein